MNKGLLLCSFSLGAALGALVSWRILKTKYEQLTQDEIDAYKEYVKNKESADVESEVKVVEDISEQYADEDTSMFDLHELVKGYTSVTSDREEVTTNVNKPYIITPEEYGDQDGYDAKSLTQFADGIIADERDRVIKNPKALIGDDIESHYGEYDDDVVYVRNTELMCDYEICRDEATYEEAIGFDDESED